VLIEAGQQMPKSIGPAVSIVGGLVVGEAAVNAKFISPGVVVMVAVSIIANFAMVNQDIGHTLRIFRFLFAVMASFLGLAGISFLTLLLIIYLADMDVMGIPYLAPLISRDKSGIKDEMMRAPLFAQKERFRYFGSSNRRRRGR